MSHKYHAKATVVDGIRFASKAESRRYGELKLLVQADFIRNLEIQPVLPLFTYRLSTGEQTHIGNYVGDFMYYDVERNQQVLEDVKGMKTAVYRLKKKLVEAQYDTPITEVTVRR